MTDKRPLRILHVLGTLEIGGAESRIMDLYRHIDRERVQFDFLVHTDAVPSGGAGYDSDSLMAVRRPQAFDAEVRSLGGRIYALPRPDTRHLLRYQEAVTRFFHEHNDFAAVEGHMTSMASIYLPAAKRAGIPVTMSHVRSGGSGSGMKKLLTDLMRSSLSSHADRLLSCTMEAGLFVYGKKAAGRIEVIPNAIETARLAYDPAVREQVREELAIPADAVVAGHVGRFDPVKNQAFILDIAAKEKLRSLPDPGMYYVFVGDGNGRAACAEKAASCGLEDRVRFTGICSRERTAQLYQAFDLFLLPSLYEGMPGTAIEAQAAGLPCLLADTVTKEAEITPLVERLPLEDADVWAERIAELSGTVSQRAERSATAQQSLDAAGYNVEVLAGRMAEFYENL